MIPDLLAWLGSAAFWVIWLPPALALHAALSFLEAKGRRE